MAFFTHSDVKTGGPDVAKTNCTSIHLVKNPLKADTWATFLTKIVASATITDTDWTYTPSGEEIVVTTPDNTGVTPSGTALAADDLSIAAVDTANQIVYVVQDVTNRDINNTDPVTIPGIDWTIKEPVAAP